ncbi:MAG: type II secretion system protein GspG [Chlamydiae bacterium]|nr:type II secretion system protein GspG [Chlamydiota bacterium]MBI3277720.1 type II secretion system protein GspG [Chlamydiota bacterium]
MRISEYRNDYKSFDKSGPCGFTITEMLVVVVIVGIILAMSLPTAKTSFEKMRIHQTQTDIAKLEMALEGYKSKYGVYPNAGSGQSVPRSALENSTDQFMHFPPERIIDGNFCDSWNMAYRYDMPGTNQPNFADIASAGPDRHVTGSWMTSTTGDDADNITNWSQNR